MSTFDEYIIAGSPSQKEKTNAWRTAIGLQDVDGLKPSQYLIDTAKKNIEGDISIQEVKDLIDKYYQSKTVRSEVESQTEEADKVSARIAEMLSEPTFNFSPDYLIQIHRRLFSGIFKLAGELRPYDITKKEWVLDGDTVLYSSHEMLRQTLEYDFREEKLVDYSSMGAEAAVKHICKFISGIWQIHPFCEGNTRTTSVFAIKYLGNFGFKIDNEVFAQNSWYFRNALVRANYVNYSKGISSTTIFLERFFENMLFGAKHELRNREMHIGYVQSANSALKADSKCKFCTLEEAAVLKILKKNPQSTQKETAEKIGKSVRTVKAITASLIEKGFLKRENGKRNGFWTVIDTAGESSDESII